MVRRAIHRSNERRYRACSILPSDTVEEGSCTTLRSGQVGMSGCWRFPRWSSAPSSGTGSSGGSPCECGDGANAALPPSPDRTPSNRGTDRPRPSAVPDPPPITSSRQEAASPSRAHLRSGIGWDTDLYPMRYLLCHPQISAVPDTASKRLLLRAEVLPEFDGAEFA